MKDRIEFRFTVATGKIETKAVNELVKVARPYATRLLEAVTKVFEAYANKEIKDTEDKE